MILFDDQKVTANEYAKLALRDALERAYYFTEHYYDGDRLTDREIEQITDAMDKQIKRIDNLLRIEDLRMKYYV